MSYQHLRDSSFQGYPVQSSEFKVRKPSTGTKRKLNQKIQKIKKSKKLEKLSTSKKIYGVKSPKSPKFGNRKKSSDDDVFMNRHSSNTSEGSSIGIVMIA